jgi:catechol 2,3-dioxygenase-like lactoylglutathione lyase family enzyme
MMITGLDHLVLNVADPERSLRFYVDVLGLEPVRVDEWRAGSAPFPSVRIDETTIVDLFPPKMHNGDGKGDNLNHFCLVTEGRIDELTTSLEALGIPIVERAEHNFGARGFATSIYITDPDDNIVEIRRY